MTWRSLGDSNPCFRRERAAKSVRGQNPIKVEERRDVRAAPPRGQQFNIFDAGSDRDIETAFATFVQRGLVRCSPVPAHS